MFNMKFHGDERSMDMTRRRRWHRKMVPSAEETLTNSFVNTDVIFRMQSQVPAITDQQSTDASTPTKEVKIELNAPRMFLTFQSQLISSFSFQLIKYLVTFFRSIFLRTTCLYLSSKKSSLNGS